MPQLCQSCTHPDREAIDRALVGGEGAGTVADRFGLSSSSVDRHARNHLVALLAEATEREEARAVDLWGQINATAMYLNRMAAACDAFLEDPERPGEYTLAPRSDDVEVVYLEGREDGPPVRRKAKLSELLERVEGRFPVASVEARFADPRELLLKTAAQLTRQCELLAKVNGLDSDGTVTAADIARLQTIVMEALQPFPEARRAVVEALRGADG
jgi:hypothetical protein